MEGWVDLGYPAMHRPGVELATSRSQVRRPNHYTTEPEKVTRQLKAVNADCLRILRPSRFCHVKCTNG